jgi:hypothetical protein
MPGRLEGKTADMAVCPAADEAGVVTGATMMIDGGWTL